MRRLLGNEKRPESETLVVVSTWRKKPGYYKIFKPRQEIVLIDGEYVIYSTSRKVELGKRHSTVAPCEQVLTNVGYEKVT